MAEDKLKELLENLAKDLVYFEENGLLTEEQLAKVTETYSKVYEVILKLKSL